MKAILISCYDFHYDLRLKYVENILIERGFQVKKIFSDYDHLRKKRTTYTDPSVIEISVPSYQKNISIKRLYSHIIFSCKLKKVLRTEKPNLIYADIPPNSIALGVASHKKRDKNCIIIFDILDLWPESFSKSKWLKLPFWFWKKIRTLALPKADYITLECDYYQQFLNPHLKKGMHSTLYLCKPPLEEKLRFSHPEDTLNFCYLGSINNIINIPAIVEMLLEVKTNNDNKAIPRKTKLYIIGDGENREVFLNQLKDNGIDFEYAGAIYDEEKKNEILRRCHFGINMYNSSVAIGLTMKSLDYFRVGLPTINMNIMDTGILVDKYKSGYDISKDNWSEVINHIVTVDNHNWGILHSNTIQMFNDLFTESVFNSNFNKVLDKLQK